MKFPANTKFRVVYGPISFYATKSQIRKGIGDNGQFNKACMDALDSMEKMGNIFVVGIAGCWNDFSIQLDAQKS